MITYDPRDKAWIEGLLPGHFLALAVETVMKDYDAWLRADIFGNLNKSQMAICKKIPQNRIKSVATDVDLLARHLAKKVSVNDPRLLTLGWCYTLMRLNKEGWYPGGTVASMSALALSLDSQEYPEEWQQKKLDIQIVGDKLFDSLIELNLFKPLDKNSEPEYLM